MAAGRTCERGIGAVTGDFEDFVRLVDEEFEFIVGELAFDVELFEFGGDGLGAGGAESFKPFAAREPVLVTASEPFGQVGGLESLAVRAEGLDDGRVGEAVAHEGIEMFADSVGEAGDVADAPTAGGGGAGRVAIFGRRRGRQGGVGRGNGRLGQAGGGADGSGQDGHDLKLGGHSIEGAEMARTLRYG